MQGPRRTLFSWPDIKLSIRLLIRNPGLTLVSSLGITVGIAITAGMFGFLHATLAPTLPLDEGDRIVALENWDVAKNNENRQSLHDFVTWRDQMTSVVEIGAFQDHVALMQTGDRLPEMVRVAAMSASGFRMARVRRTFCVRTVMTNPQQPQPQPQQPSPPSPEPTPSPRPSQPPVPQPSSPTAQRRS